MAKRGRKAGLFAGYLLVDIEGSVGKSERRPKHMRGAERRYRKIVSKSVARHGGLVRDFSGDGVFATLPVESVLFCALEVQRKLEKRRWRKVGGLVARLGVHCGRADPLGKVDRVLVNRARRIIDCAWGGQIVLSGPAVSACTSPDGAEYVDFGAHRLKGLEEPLQIFGLTHKRLRASAFPPLRSSANHGAQLAPQAAPIFGRDAELEAVLALLGAEARVVSIVGAPGVGKTRLALEAGASASKRRAVYFVSLEDVDAAEAALAAIARQLAFPFHDRAAPEHQLRDYLRDKEFLILLDNADALVGHADFIGRLGGPGVRFLITSREPLSLADETTFSLSGLTSGDAACPLPQSAAFLLFSSALRRIGSRFELDPSQHERFAAICEEVEGSPLALQLVAHWTSVLTLGEILERLRAGVGFLGGLGGAQLQHGLSRAMYGSWALLDAEQRQALASLSIFHGSFDLGAALEVAHVDARLIRHLEAKSLIQWRGERCYLHPFLKEHASARLHQDFEPLEAPIGARYVDYFLGIVRASFSSIDVARQRTLLDRVEHELTNIKAAWALALSAAPQSAQAALEHLFYALILRAHLADCIGLFSIETRAQPLQAYLEAARASCEVQLGDHRRAAPRAIEALNKAGGVWQIAAHCHQTLGNVAHLSSQFEEASHHYQAAFALRSVNGDEVGSYYAAISLAWLYLQMSDLDQAQMWLDRAFELCHRLGQFGVSIMAYSCAGDIALRRDLADLAGENYQRALEVEERFNHPHLRAPLLVKLADLAARTGDGVLARARLEDARAMAFSIGDRRVAVNAWLKLARLNSANEHDRGATRAVLCNVLDYARTLPAPQIGRVLLALGLAQIGENDRRQCAIVAGILLWPVFETLSPEVEALRHNLLPVTPVASRARDLDEAIQEVLNNERFGLPVTAS